VSQLQGKGENSQEMLFFSIGKCIEYLKSKGIPANPKTLEKYIDTGISY